MMAIQNHGIDSPSTASRRAACEVDRAAVGGGGEHPGGHPDDGGDVSIEKKGQLDGGGGAFLGPAGQRQASPRPSQPPCCR
jgi:hypothetical protein